MRGRALLQQLLCYCKGAVVDDRFVVVFKHDVLVLVKRYITAVDLLPLEFVLSESADIEVVAENFGHGHDAPRFLDLALVFVALRFLACFLPHTGRWDMLVGQMIGDPFIAPSVDIESEYLSDDLGRRLVHLEQHFL